MSPNYTTAFTVDQSPEEAFKAIVDVRNWWTGDVEGETDSVGDVFTYRYVPFHYSKQEITDIEPDRKVVWRVTEADLAGLTHPDEWVGTEITFTVVPQGDKTEVRFSHLGLVPEFECYDSCSSAWSFYINSSLRDYITTGEGPATPPWA